MKIKDYNVELINSEYSENKAENDSEKDFFHSSTYEEGSSYYYKIDFLPQLKQGDS